MSTVVVAGLGYVGLPLAVRSAEAGHTVVGVDLDREKVDAVSSGASYVDDVGDERLDAVVADGRFRAITADMFSDPHLGGVTSFDVGVITVPTPVRGDQPDLSYVVAAARMLGSRLRPSAVVVLESTTYPGTTEGPVADAIFDVCGLLPGADYYLGFSPERVDPGNSVHTFETTPKIVSGTDPAALAKVRAFYDTLVLRTVAVSSTRVAEFAKLFENIFSQVNIALVNEMAILAHELDIDVWEAIDAADTKPHGFLKHTPGPGVGGHCIPVDPVYLAWLARARGARPLQLCELAQQVNDGMPEYVVERAAEMLSERGLASAEVLLIGVAYKPGTDDIRGAPALDIIRLLREKGAAVTVADPYLRQWAETPMLALESVISSVGDFDLTIIVTDHDDFDYDKLAEAARLVLDCRGRMASTPKVQPL
jgi:UDP-N-acetyl-D-glucosamine dehydrogenase